MPVPVAVNVTELPPIASVPRARLPLAAVDCSVKSEVNETAPVVVILPLADRVRVPAVAARGGEVAAIAGYCS